MDPNQEEPDNVNEYRRGESADFYEKVMNIRRKKEMPYNMHAIALLEKQSLQIATTTLPIPIPINNKNNKNREVYY